MQSRALLGIAAVALALVATAVVALRPASDPAPASAQPAPGAARAPDARPSPSSRPDPLGDALQRMISQPREPHIELPPAEARREAEASFEHIMTTLEELADASKRLPAARRDELYRNTNDAFSALSATLDPNSAADMQMLEDANIRMKAMLHELGVRVPRRPPIGEP